MEAQIKKIILVVEDDESINLAYKKALENAGFEVIFASTGEQGCDLIKKHKPNLILLDIMLKGQQNGFDVLNILQSNDDTKEIPIFVMTNLDTTHEQEAIEMGAKKFFVKSNISFEEIIKNIQEFI